MIVEYLFSSSEGDIAIAPDDLRTPFKITPSKHHPFLTLGDYFKAIEEFVRKQCARFLAPTFQDGLHRAEKLLIRSEKHGALYHLASVAFVFDGRSLKYAVSTAVSEKGKAWLNHEYHLLKYLAQTFDLSYLPKVHLKGNIERRVGRRTESLSMCLSEWFEDYHEWHLTRPDTPTPPLPLVEDPASWRGGGEQEGGESIETKEVLIWDQEEGHRFATQEESFEIIKQASKILTLYYDLKDFRQIYPWHHAAGDFVVKAKEGRVDVKLTTARGYDPVMTFVKEEDINPLLALIYFFLNLTIKMRLDKVDGVGEVIWAGDFSVEATAEGFFEALQIKETEGKYHPGKLEDLLSLLEAFNQEELYKLLRPLLKAYQGDDPGDYSVISGNLEGHAAQLWRVIQRRRE